MPVAAYQGVRTITMGAAGYSVPLTGISYPGYWIGMQAANGAWGQNPNFALPTEGPGLPIAYSPITDLNSPVAGPGTNPAQVWNFQLYQFTPTALKTWSFIGGPELPLTFEANYFNGAFQPLIVGNLIYFSFVNPIGPHVLWNQFDITTPGSISGANASIIQSGAPNGSSPSADTESWLAVCTDGTDISLFASNHLPGVAQFWATTDFSQPVNSFDQPVGIESDLVVGYDRANGITKWLGTLTDHSMQIVDVTIDPVTTNIAFGTPGILTFDNDLVTQIPLVVDTAFTWGKFFESLNGWILRGAVIAGSSGWYFLSADYTQYWVLQFSSGPSDPTYGPVADTLGNIYTVDQTDGAVFVMGGSPPAPVITPLSIQQTPPYPLSKCFTVLKLRGQC